MDDFPSAFQLAVLVVATVILVVVLTRWRAQLFRGVPELSAGAAGLFRVVLGASLLYAVPLAFNPGSTRDYPWWGSWEWIDALASNPGAVVLIKTITMVALTLFAVGALTRVAHAVSAVGLLLLLLVLLENTGAHDWGMPVLAFAALGVVPLGDGFSVDEAVRRFRRRPSRAHLRGQSYGLAVWIPGFFLGVALCAAAYAKLHYSGLEWALGGAVQYHFVDDGLQAPTQIGLWVAAHAPVAVALSMIGLLTEATFIAHIFFASSWVRAGFGAVITVLLLGFWLFQGIFWIAWWILVIAFLPWEEIYQAARSAIQARGEASREDLPAVRRAGLGFGPALLVAAVLSLQIVLSSAAVEREPLTNFPMYALTSPSRKAYDASRFGTGLALDRFHELRYRGVSTRGDVRDASELIAGSLLETQLVAPEAPSPSRLARTQADELRRIADAYRESYGERLARVDVVPVLIQFDWESGVFAPVLRPVIPIRIPR